MKIYAVQYYYDGSDTEDAFAEWFTTKTEAIARAKEINIDPENVIRGVTAYKSEVPTTKKAMLKWLNDCKGVQFVPGNQVIWEQPSTGAWGSE
jgi:hypothetical protein